MAKISHEERVRIETATAWRPVPGDGITGTIVAIKARETEYGKHPVLIIDTGADTYTAVHAFHAVLRNSLFDIKPTPGDKIAINYAGKVDGKNQPYHSYTVFDPDAEHNAQEFSWDEPDDPQF